MCIDKDLKAKVVIFGGRDYCDKETFFKEVDNIFDEWELTSDWVEIVEGGAKGADYLAKLYAEERGISHKQFKANWDKYGKSAGPLRNKKMAEYCKGQYGIAFWDGKSKGTENMLNNCENFDIKVQGLLYNQD